MAGFEGLDPGFVGQLQRLQAVCPFTVISGHRTHEEQQRLYDEWKAGKRNVPAVATPGTSKHESGFAADISGDYACFQMHAPSLGLHFPVKGEPWHVQPMSGEGRGGAGELPAEMPAHADPVAAAEAAFMATVIIDPEAPKDPVAMQAQQNRTGAAMAPTTATAGGDWQASLTPAERWILEKESGLNPAAQNPKSTAFGLWQGLEETRKQYLGDQWQTTDPTLQLGAFRRYVADRYGTPEAAKEHHEQFGWY